MVSLSTAWEWIVEKRAQSGEEYYRELSWLEPLDEKAQSTNETSLSSWDDIPLYPIPAVYLPVAGVNHTLNNVEPRNIQMTLDLTSEKSDGMFCLALRAADTGRIARVGTLMKLLHADPHYASDDGTIARFTVTCVALEPVTIDSINNGQEAENRVSRLMRSPVYLKANLSRRKAISEVDSSGSDQVDQLLKDYAFVRCMYIDGVGQDDIPMFARLRFEEDLDEWSTQMFETDEGFWKAAYSWQRLCNTVREGRQIDLSTDRNEIMIEAASQKGGPLKLPIHMEDLPLDIQQQLRQMEVDRLEEFAFKCQMDPILDFLVLLQEETLHDRILHLSRMVARERRRLTEAALRGGATKERNKSNFSGQPRRGAWFDNES